MRLKFMGLIECFSIGHSNACSVKRRVFGLVGVVGFLVSPLGYSQSEQWCYVNPSHPLPGNARAAVEVSRESIFPVRAKLQDHAQGMLKDVSVVELSFQYARFFVPNLEPSRNQVYYYLVRASAVYDESRDLSTLAFAATVFSDTHTLNVYSFALRSPDVKLKNLALVIRTTVQVEAENAICETAS